MLKRVMSSGLMAAVALAGSCAREASVESNRSRARPAYATEDLTDDPSTHVPGGLVVDFRDGTTKSQFDAWEKAWGIDLEFVSPLDVDGDQDNEDAITVAVGVPDVAGALTLIKTHPEVEAAEPLMTYQASFVPNDPLYERQWNLKMINMPKAWEASRGKGVIVAVLDTGVAYEDHDEFRQVPDLKGARFARGYDFVNKDSHANDDHGHGTHVAGTIAQATNNGEGVAGVAFEAVVMPVKVLNHFGSGTSADIADAIRWAADHGARVINMSLGGGGRSEVMERAVMYARKKGAVVVCAAGNTGQGRVEFPAAYPGSVAVGAVGPDGTKAPYSSFGKELDIAAPGGDKRQGDEGGVLQNTIDPRDPARSVYAAYQGTSMATPHVAGVAALLYAAGGKNPDEVEKALFAGVKSAAGEAGWSEQYGHGLLNAAGALGALEDPGQAVASDEASTAPARAGESTNWSPLLMGLLLLAGVLLTLKVKERPGYLNVLVRPAFLIPLVVATVGLFFVRHLLGASSEAGHLFSLPLPDWWRIIFGRGKLANPLFYSALIPLVLSVVAIKARGMRQVVAGLALGFAAFLGYAAWAKAPALAWLPFTFLAIPWLVVNVVVCLFITRAMLRKES